MLKIDGIEVRMEGPFSDLIKEVARLAHTISKTASEKFEEDTDGEVTYDHVVEMILEELAKLKRFDVEDIDLPEEISSDFNDMLHDERTRNKNKPSFIDYDTSRPEKDAGSKFIREVIKGVYRDPRMDDFDQEDIDAIKALKISKKKKKKK